MWTGQFNPLARCWMHPEATGESFARAWSIRVSHAYKQPECVFCKDERTHSKQQRLRFGGEAQQDAAK